MRKFTLSSDAYEHAPWFKNYGKSISSVILTHYKTWSHINKGELEGYVIFPIILFKFDLPVHNFTDEETRYAQAIINKQLEKDGHDERAIVTLFDTGPHNRDKTLYYRIVKDPARIKNRLGLLDI